CAPDSASYDLSVGSISGFTNPVTLSAAGNPVGTTVGFSVNPVVPPGASTMTIGNTGGAAGGTYAIDVTGTFGALSHTAQVSLSLATGAPALVSLTSPANGATGVAS